jgi:hypothetical protein
MYFDGTGDYLTLPNSAAALALGSNDFTLEAWVYPTTTAECTIFYINGNSNSYAAIRLATLNGNLTLLASSAGSDWNYLPTLSGVRTNAWNHVAVSRSGTSLRLFLNGTASVSTSISGSLMAGAFNWIGRINHAANYYFTGYISDARIIVGNAIYTGNYVVPTAPLTAVSGTSLLLSGTNAGIYDASMSTIVETVGDAKISTTISASGSMYFDGTGDYLTVANNAALNMEGGDFTIECWFYPTATPSASGHTLFAKRATTAAFTQVQILFVSNLTPQLYASTNGSSWGISNPTASVSCQLNSWNHIAVTRSGDTYRLFINGQVSATATLSGSLMSNSDAFSIGAGAANGGSPMTASYISNFRVVKGTAGYTTTFTPPTRS